MSFNMHPVFSFLCLSIYFCSQTHSHRWQDDERGFPVMDGRAFPSFCLSLFCLASRFPLPSLLSFLLNSVFYRTPFFTYSPYDPCETLQPADALI